jgi:hypothetical protein
MNKWWHNSCGKLLNGDISKINSAELKTVLVCEYMCGGTTVVSDFSSNDEIAVTVKKIIIPATVRTVWAGAFSNCVNLSEIYLCGKGDSQTIEIEKKALPEVTMRNFEITFHCHSTCMNRDLWQYSSRADTYNAKYKEWDPSTPID